MKLQVEVEEVDEERLAETIARQLDMPSCFMGGASYGSKRKARAVLESFRAEGWVVVSLPPKERA